MDNKINGYLGKIFLCSFLIAPLYSSAQMHSNHQMSMDHSKAKPVYLAMMDSMMIDMDRVSGQTVDSDFVIRMIPHHQGAIAMSRYQILHGKNVEMIQLAKSILTEQQVEVQLMRKWIEDKSGNGAPTGADYSTQLIRSMNLMMKDLPQADKLKDLDEAFALVMIPHHEAAIDMARAAIPFLKDPEKLSFAQALISNEKIEIEQMLNYLRKKNEK